MVPHMQNSENLNNFHLFSLLLKALIYFKNNMEFYRAISIGETTAKSVSKTSSQFHNDGHCSITHQVSCIWGHTDGVIVDQHLTSCTY